MGTVYLRNTTAPDATYQNLGAVLTHAQLDNNMTLFLRNDVTDTKEGDLTINGNLTSKINRADNILSNYFIKSPYKPVIPLPHEGSSGNLTTKNYSSLIGQAEQAPAIHPSGKYIYVANTNAGSFSQLNLNTTTGEIQSGTVFNTGSGPTGIAVHPNGKFLYVGTSGSGIVYVYPINTSSGIPSASSSNTGLIAYYISKVIIDPTGRFLYVTFSATTNAVYQYSIDQSTGGLTFINSFSLSGFPKDIKIDPTGRYLYISYAPVSGNKYIFVTSINQSTGELSPLSEESTGSIVVEDMVVHPNGNFLYGIAPNSNLICTFSINQSNGSVELLSPTTATFYAVPRGIDIAPNGQFLYISFSGSYGISTYSVNQYTGQLISTQNSGQGYLPFKIIVDPSGRFCIITSYSSARIGLASLQNSALGDLLVHSLRIGTTEVINSSGQWLGIGISVSKGGTGNTSLAANSVLLGNGTSAVQTVAPGTSGNVLTSNGTTWVSQAASGGGITTGKAIAMAIVFG